MLVYPAVENERDRSKGTAGLSQAGRGEYAVPVVRNSAFRYRPDERRMPVQMICVKF